MMQFSKPWLREIALAAGLVFMAATVRCLWPSRMAIEHFDEGVYASGRWFQDEAEPFYPRRYLYAPPLLPATITWTTLLTGDGDLAAVAPVLLAGVATVGLMWWLAGAWFGPEAGVAAGVITACSSFHILYSRTVLVDVPRGLFLLAAVGFGAVALQIGRQGRVRYALLAGFATALAWWTKYDGWLPLAIVAAGAFGRSLCVERKTGFLRGTVVALGLMAVTAVLLWSPVLLGLKPYGGYAVVAANHRQYLVGFAGWWPSLLRQATNLRVIDSWLDEVGLALAVVAAATYRWCSTWNAPSATKPHSPSDSPTTDTAVTNEARRVERTETLPSATSCQTAAAPEAPGWWETVALALVIFAATRLLGTAIVFAALSLIAMVGIVAAKRRRDGGRNRPAEAHMPLVWWILAAWFAGLLVATPFYRPYPRLALPWLMSAWIGSSAAIGLWCRRETTPAIRIPPLERLRSRLAPSLRSGVLFAAGLLSALVAVAVRPVDRMPVAWEDRSGMKRLAPEIMEAAVSLASRAHRPDQDRLGLSCVIYVYAEPGLFFHLARLAEQRSKPGRLIVVRPVNDLGFAPPNSRYPNVPTFLVAGPHAFRTESFRTEWGRLGSLFRPVSEPFAYRPSTLVRLNQGVSEPGGVAQTPQDETVTLHVLGWTID